MQRSDGPWCCTVTLRFVTDESGQALQQPRNVAFGDPLLSTEKVEDRLRRAQRAILNPSTNPQNS